jgi:Ubiquitin-2 like Rad60 SUMO-like.
MSDSDSSISTNYVSSKRSELPLSARKRPRMSLQQSDDGSSGDTSAGSDEDAAFTFSRHRFSASSGGSEQKQNIESDSDSEDSVLKNMKGFKTAATARFSKKTRELHQDSDSDNGLEIQVVGSNAETMNNTKGGNAFISHKAKTIMVDSEDSDDEKDKLQILESEAMKKARLAREALSAAPVGIIDIQDDDDNIDDENDDNDDSLVGYRSRIQPPPRQQPLPKGPIIKIKFRANIQSAPAHHNGKTMHSKSITLPLHSDTRVEEVMNSYRQKVNPTISTGAKVIFMLDGLPMNMNKTMQDYDLDDEDLIDVLINIPLTAQIQPPPKQPPLPKGPIIKIKFRANIQSAPAHHNARSMHSKSISLPFSSTTTVEEVMNSYRQKVIATITPGAKVTFILDGLPMNMNRTLQDYDLEDEDLIDVLINILS